MVLIAGVAVYLVVLWLHFAGLQVGGGQGDGWFGVLRQADPECHRRMKELCKDC